MLGLRVSRRSATDTPSAACPGCAVHDPSRLGATEWALVTGGVGSEKGDRFVGDEAVGDPLGRAVCPPEFLQRVHLGGAAGDVGVERQSLAGSAGQVDVRATAVSTRNPTRPP